MRCDIIATGILEALNVLGKYGPHLPFTSTPYSSLCLSNYLSIYLQSLIFALFFFAFYL